MGIEINISGTKISGNARVLNNAVIKNNDDVCLKLQESEISGQADLLNNLEISSVLEELNRQVLQIDKNIDEYPRIQEILKEKHWNKNSFAKRIAAHLSEFSQGVLASIVANFLMDL